MRFLLALLTAIILGIAFGWWVGGIIVSAEPAPPRPEQKRPDIFPLDPIYVPRDVDGDGDRDMQDLNPTTVKAKQTRSIAYRVVTLSGCNPGLMPADLERMNTVEAPKLGLTLRRNDTVYDFTVYISCGLTQIQKCGSVNVFCLPDGFPYVTDVYMSDVLSNWDIGSRTGIPLHEIAGHAIGTWNEQYATCGSSCGFAPTPGLRDVMNTGPDSRHGVEAVELERWERTMWTLTPPCEPTPAAPCWDGEVHDFGNGWTWDPDPQPCGTWAFNGVIVWEGGDPSWGGRGIPGWGYVHGDTWAWHNEAGSVWAPRC